jgi:hypothetical protein
MSGATQRASAGMPIFGSTSRLLAGAEVFVTVSGHAIALPQTLSIGFALASTAIHRCALEFVGAFVGHERTSISNVRFRS